LLLYNFFGTFNHPAAVCSICVLFKISYRMSVKINARKCPEESGFENCIEMKHSHGPIKLFLYPVPMIFHCDERISEV
jgi:hypothetical protein